MGQTVAEVIEPGTMLINEDQQNHICVALVLDRFYWFLRAIEERRRAYININPAYQEEKLKSLHDIYFNENIVLVYLVGLKHRSISFPFSYYYVNADDVNFGIVSGVDILSLRRWILASCPNGNSGEVNKIRENAVQASLELGVLQRFFVGEYLPGMEELHNLFAKGMQMQ